MNRARQSRKENRKAVHPRRQAENGGFRWAKCGLCTWLTRESWRDLYMRKAWWVPLHTASCSIRSSGLSCRRRSLHEVKAPTAAGTLLKSLYDALKSLSAVSDEMLSGSSTSLLSLTRSSVKHVNCPMSVGKDESSLAWSQSNFSDLHPAIVLGKAPRSRLCEMASLSRESSLQTHSGTWKTSVDHKGATQTFDYSQTINEMTALSCFLRSCEAQ